MISNYSNPFLIPCICNLEMFLDDLDNGLEKVGFVDGFLALQHFAHSFKPHSRIYILLRKLRENSIF